MEPDCIPLYARADSRGGTGGFVIHMQDTWLSLVAGGTGRSGIFAAHGKLHVQDAVGLLQLHVACSSHCKRYNSPLNEAHLHEHDVVHSAAA